MNLTVGPLPPAVYWRRRALVLGVVLVLVILLVSMCGGSAGKDTHDRGAGGGIGVSASPTPSQSSLAPIIGGPGSDTGSGASPTASVTGSAGQTGGSGAAAGTADLCTDAEIQLTPSIQKIVGGTYPYLLTLKIRNISTRTCKRDVGAGPQEMHIVATANQVVWSSDYCQSTGGSSVRTFAPNVEASFQVPWDGHSYGPGCKVLGALAPGGYQVVAKLDSKVSASVGFTVAGGAGSGS